MQLPLFEPARLARRPYCTNGLDDGLVIRGVDRALERAYVQTNHPAILWRVVVDVDHEIYTTAACGDWRNVFNAPEPNWTAATRKTGHAHVGYEIEIPVARHEHARQGPIRLAAAIETGLIDLLKGDAGYAGLVCKNPTHDRWRTVPGRLRPYDLPELAEWVDLERPKGKATAPATEGSLSRNVALFDKLRFWAYGQVGTYRDDGRGDFDAWRAAVERQAAAWNHFAGSKLLQTHPMALSEIRAIARSVAKWTWEKFGTGQAAADAQAQFSDIQKWRQARSAAVRRAETERAIYESRYTLSVEGLPFTKANVAREIGVSQSTLSKHYASWFETNGREIRGQGNRKISHS